MFTIARIWCSRSLEYAVIDKAGEAGQLFARYRQLEAGLSAAAQISLDS